MRDGGSAFPMPYSTDEHQNPCNATISAPGMSLRDWFAGQALAGCGGQWFVNLSGDPNPDATVAEWCYGVADAMIAARD